MRPRQIDCHKQIFSNGIHNEFNEYNFRRKNQKIMQRQNIYRDVFEKHPTNSYACITNMWGLNTLKLEILV